MSRAKSIYTGIATLAVAAVASLMVTPSLAQAEVVGCVARPDTVTFTDSYPARNVYRANVFANDSIPAGVEAAISGYTPSGGNWWVVEGTSFGYTPVDGFVGTETVRYELRDRSTKQVCSSATITIQANLPHYKRLAAANDSAATTGTQEVTVPVIANDRFISPPSIVSITNHTPALGSFTAVHDVKKPYSSVRFTPTNAPSGVARATYHLRDAYGQTSSAVLSIDVTHVNQAPNPERHYFTTKEDTAFTGSVVTAATDPDGPTLQVSVRCQPSYGTVNMHSNGTFTYTPARDISGVRDTFCYQVSDGQYTANNMVHIDIEAVDDAPRAKFDVSKHGKRDKEFSTASYTLDKDNYNSELTLRWHFGDGKTRTTKGGTTFTHTYKKAGTYNVTLIVTDPSGASSKYTRTITL